MTGVLWQGCHERKHSNTGHCLQAGKDGGQEKKACTSFTTSTPAARNGYTQKVCMHDFEVQAQERTRAHPFPFGDRLNGISWIRRQTDIEKPMALHGTVKQLRDACELHAGQPKEIELPLDHLQ